MKPRKGKKDVKIKVGRGNEHGKQGEWKTEVADTWFEDTLKEVMSLPQPTTIPVNPGVAKIMREVTKDACTD